MMIFQNLAINIINIITIIIIKKENSYNLDMSIAASYVKNPFLFFLGMRLDYIFHPLLRISTVT